MQDRMPEKGTATYDAIVSFLQDVVSSCPGVGGDCMADPCFANDAEVLLVTLGEDVPEREDEDAEDGEDYCRCGMNSYCDVHPNGDGA